MSSETVFGVPRRAALAAVAAAVLAGAAHRAATYCPPFPRGRVVVITGASSGIGAELAVQYGRAGARLVLAARREKELNAVGARARSAGAAAP